MKYEIRIYSIEERVSEVCAVCKQVKKGKFLIFEVAIASWLARFRGWRGSYLAICHNCLLEKLKLGGT